VELSIFSYRFADEILEAPQFRNAKKELIDILRRTPVIPLETAKPPRREGYRGQPFTTDQTAMNRWFDGEFKLKSWEYHPDITGDGVTRLKADFRKGGMLVEIQFGNMARWYTDVFKLQISYSLGKTDVGVLVAPTQGFAGTIDENIAYYERIIRELPYAKMSLTLPILVVGLYSIPEHAPKPLTPEGDDAEGKTAPSTRRTKGSRPQG
jgi:Restriction endonuclease BglII